MQYLFVFIFIFIFMLSISIADNIANNEVREQSQYDVDGRDVNNKQSKSFLNVYNKDGRTYTPYDFNEYKTSFSISFNATNEGLFGHAFITIHENSYLPTIEVYNIIEHSTLRINDFSKIKYLTDNKSLGKYPKSRISKIMFFDLNSALKDDNNVTPEYTLTVQVDYKTYIEINDMVKKIQESNSELYILAKQDCVSFIISIASEISNLKIPKRSLQNSLPSVYLKELIEINKEI